MDGLKIIRTIQSTDRFDTYEAELSGRKVFAKKAKTKKTRELLTGLPKNSAVVDRLGAKSGFNFRAPKVYEQKGDWLITEWIVGNSLGEDVVLKPNFVADVLTRFFVAFDNEPVRSKGFRQIFTIDGLGSRMGERISKDLRAEQIKILTQVKKLFDELASTLVPSLQDADIKPDHIFGDPAKEGAYVLVDSEHLSSQWPRFFDLANNFAKFWIRDQKSFSNILLKAFLEKSEVSDREIFKPLVASIVVRGIALHWEPDYDPGAENYNIPRAQAMLKACLAARNLDDLSST